MFFYNFNELDNFINNDSLVTNLIQEKEVIKKIIDLYTSKKETLLNIISNIITTSDSVAKNKLDTFYQTTSSLKKSYEDVLNIQNLATKLDNNINSTIGLYSTGIENNNNEIKANLIEYNKQKDDLLNKILTFEKSNTTNINSTVGLFSNNPNKLNYTNNKISNIVDDKIVNVETSPYDYNTLIISEQNQKAYLPFFYSTIENIYQKSNKYNTLQDIVNTLYVIPLSRFKNSTISRFREGFNLIKNKENGSITKAIDLGLELLFKYELNPIIIAACRNLDELDIYLNCLEENELDNFTCFEIKFEVMPKIIKK